MGKQISSFNMIYRSCGSIEWSSCGMQQQGSSSCCLYNRRHSLFARSNLWSRTSLSSAALSTSSLLKSTSIDTAMTADHDDPEFIYTVLDNNDINSNDNNQISSRHNVQHILSTIEHAAYTASSIAISTSGIIDIQRTKANTRDLVTDSDIQCQNVIRGIIMKEFPTALFLGEEDVVDDSSQDDDGGSSQDDDGGASSAALMSVLEKSLSSSSSGVTMEEEEGATVSSAEEEEDRLVFIVDPIDGTTNFQAGLPIYAMSIGVVSLQQHSSSSSSSSSPEVIAGVIYNPALGEMISAVKGRGCYLNNRRLDSTRRQKQQQHSSSPPKSILSQSLINVGFPVCKESTLHASSKAVTALATKVRGLRMVACASQAMAWVAQSKFNAYFSWDLNGWDVAAGIVIVEEAGGLVSNFDGSRANVCSRDMIITCPSGSVGDEKEGLLRDELIEVLRENDCFEY
jgi:myo-inositol-1(or 4)-monophosphatase